MSAIVLILGAVVVDGDIVFGAFLSLQMLGDSEVY